MKPAPEAVSRGPPEPIIIDRERFYNPRQAAQIVEVSEATMGIWAKKRRCIPCGLELDVRLEPMTHHRRSTQTPRTFRQTRFLIPEAQVYAMKKILQTEPKRPGSRGREERASLEAAARQFRPRLSHL